MNKYIDESIKPGDDFFKYATGKWIDYNPQPKEFPIWQTFTKLANDNIHIINDIITTHDNSELSKKINTLYNIIMDSERREADGIQPLKDYINKFIIPIKTRDEFINFVSKEHYSLFFNLYVSIDEKNNTNHILQLWQDGLSLGNKEYYLNPDKDKKRIVKAFKKFIISVLTYYGYSLDDATYMYKRLWDIEKKMAKLSYSIEEQQEPSLNYNKIYVKDACRLLKFPLIDYIKTYGYDEVTLDTEINVPQVNAIKYGCKLLNTLSLEDLKNYLIISCITGSASQLNDELYDIYFEYNKVITGAEEPLPKWKRAVNTINNICDDVIAQIYVKKYFSEESKHKVEELVNCLIKSFHSIIEEQTWMSDSTKSAALNKLSKIRTKIGYPNKYIDLSGIPIIEGESYFQTMLNLHPYFFNITKELHYNKPVDPDEWFMSPQTVNAYYSPVNNEIVFPAAILQAPFFSMEQSMAANFGSIGAVIGHEMTHGFDNHGRQFDEDGMLNEWWSESDINAFNNLTERTKEHFNNLEVLPGLKCNGSLTLGENLADYGGLRIAYNAMQEYYKNHGINDENKEKEFFISYAISWAGVNTEESIKEKTLNNEHSVNYMRVNGTLPMFSPWYDAFNITENDKLYIKPENRAKIW